MTKGIDILKDNLYRIENDEINIIFSAKNDIEALEYYYLTLSKLASLTKVQPQEEIELSKPFDTIFSLSRENEDLKYELNCAKGISLNLDSLYVKAKEREAKLELQLKDANMTIDLLEEAYNNMSILIKEMVKWIDNQPSALYEFANKKYSSWQEQAQNLISMSKRILYGEE